VIDWPVNPEKTALINVDLQNVFVEGYDISAPDGPACVDRLNRLSAVCRAHGIMVIHTAQEPRADGSNVGIAAEVVMSYLNDHDISRGWLGKPVPLSPYLEVEDSDVVLIKPRTGAFTGTDLDLILRTNGVEAVIIGGIATNVCCDTTAREASMRDYKVFFLSDGTTSRGLGDLSAEDIKKAVLETIRFAFGQVLTVDEMIAKVEVGISRTACAALE